MLLTRVPSATVLVADIKILCKRKSRDSNNIVIKSVIAVDILLEGRNMFIRQYDNK